jgi:hypothetical protein
MWSRRRVLQGGLAGLAAALASRSIAGCGAGGGSPADGRIPDGPIADAAAAAPDATSGFPVRDVPPRPALRSRLATLGAHGEPDANGIRLPAGMTSRLLARGGEPALPSAAPWHIFPDGGATFATEDGGWIYVSNSEVPGLGGASALRFDAGGALVSSRRILERTSLNCAGGPTPWSTCLSCEEDDHGRVFECDPWGEVAAVWRPALGSFKHEAVSVDAVRQHLYLTEDVPDGRLYRLVPDGLTPAGHADLTAGRLEVAMVALDGGVTWLALPDPGFEGAVPTRLQIPESTSFNGGEGIWVHEGIVYFSTKGDDRIWSYDTGAARLSVLYDGKATGDILSGVDNIAVSCCGDVLVAEDGGDMEIVAILPAGELRSLLQVVGQGSSEITGPAFDPSGTRLYFSSQRGGAGGGLTYEVTGPFHEPA